MAERVGFEPTVPFDTPHFECGAIDHSATSPAQRGRERRPCPTKQKTKIAAPLDYLSPPGFGRARRRSYPKGHCEWILRSPLAGARRHTRPTFRSLLVE